VSGVRSWTNEQFLVISHHPSARYLYGVFEKIYLSEVPIILPIFLFVHPFLWNVIIFFVSNFHFAQETLGGETLWTNSCLEKAFTGLLIEKSELR